MGNKEGRKTEFWIPVFLSSLFRKSNFGKFFSRAIAGSDEISHRKTARRIGERGVKAGRGRVGIPQVLVGFQNRRDVSRRLHFIRERFLVERSRRVFSLKKPVDFPDRP
jgi:hypothetical protein